MEPLPQNGTFSQCAKHPSQNSTGICSSCLMERLSSVNSVQPNPNLNTATTSSQSCEIEEIQSKPVSPNADRNTNHKNPEVRLRKTLLLLFQLDDESQNGNHENSKFGNEINTNSTSKEAQFDANSNSESKSKGKSPSFRLSSILPKWRKRETINKGNLEENKENKNSFRYSFDLPRHSWDGSIGKKMACSFACLEERKGRRRRETMSETLEGSKTLEVGTGARVLERSLSESGTDRERKIRRGPSRRFRNLNINRGGNANANANANVNLNAGLNGDSGLNNNLNVKPDTRKNGELGFGRKRELGFGRSRSVHYQSPAGNLDNNGLLRFYLTPLRSRSTNKGRRRNSRFFAGGLFGFF